MLNLVLLKATAARNMQEIEAASALIERANAKLSAIKKHREKKRREEKHSWKLLYLQRRRKYRH